MELENTQNTSDSAVKMPVFFSVSTRKFFLMMLCTFGIYQIYWFWRNWTAVKEQDKSEIMPFGRSVFGIFFALELFRKISSAAKQNGYLEVTREDTMALIYIGISVLVNVVSRFSGYVIADISYILYWLILLPFLQMQKQINFNNLRLDPSYLPESKFSFFEKVIVIFGGLLFIASLVGVGLEFLGVVQPQ